MISKDTIEEVKNRIDIVEVVSDFLSLKKSGKDYKALSPFAHERTPSFFVVPSKGIFKDFSSGKGGDAITFVMEHEKMSYSETIRYLAAKYGVEIKEDASVNPEEFSQQESLYIAMGFARDFFQKNLTEKEEGQIGLNYFQMERRFSDAIIRKFELGYALQGWDLLMKEALKSGYGEEALEKSGLIVVKEEKRYDRFRGRVMFPVHNLSGKVIAFGARMMGSDPKQPKYLNSPETEIYSKGEALYGIYQSRNAIRQADLCYLVEGYTDVISMHQAGVENVVSSSGTSLTEKQIRLIKRFTNNVTVLFDGDAAGIRAAIRGVDMILKGGLHVRVVRLPDGEDPDSYSNKAGLEELKKYLSVHQQDFISFKVALYAEEAANDPYKKAEAIKEISASISVIPDSSERTVFVQNAAKLLNTPEDVFFTELNKILIRERRKAHPQEEEKPPAPIEHWQEGIDIGNMVQRQETETIRLLLLYADHKIESLAIHTMLDELSDVGDFENPVCQYVFNEFMKAAEQGIHLNTSDVLDKAEPKARNFISGLLVKKIEASPNWEKHKIYFQEYEGEKTILRHVLLFKYRFLQHCFEKEKEKLKSAADELLQNDTLDRLLALKESEKELAAALGIDSGKY